jgi:hypothetical protein
MDIRVALFAALLSFALPAASQIQSATGPKPKPLPAAPRAAHNSMSKTTTPFNCEQYKWPNHPHPGMKPFCDQMEARTLQDEARYAGRPSPSTEVVPLPALGSDAAKRSGFACIGGQAFRKLSNGWEQISSPSGGWQRCRVQ